MKEKQIVFTAALHASIYEALMQRKKESGMARNWLVTRAIVEFLEKPLSIQALSTFNINTNVNNQPETASDGIAQSTLDSRV